MEITIGGNRVGSGKKMRGKINNYERSTHNLNEIFASSVSCGILYPVYKKICTRGDKFDIDINADCRTIPTKGPLFGSYKLQIDFYQCPIRLYQALLHNNPISIGLKMGQVKLPTITIPHTLQTNNYLDGEFSKSCLLKYLGMSGIGKSSDNSVGVTISRKIQCVPLLAYYDIFKNYYANKQEDKAYVITADKTVSKIFDFRLINAYYKEGETEDYIEFDPDTQELIPQTFEYIQIQYERRDRDNEYANEKEAQQLHIKLYRTPGIKIFEGTIEEMTENSNAIVYYIDTLNSLIIQAPEGAQWTYKGYRVWGIECTDTIEIAEEDKLKIVDFNLSNIDDMRYEILTHHTLGSAYNINSYNYYPYKANFGVTTYDSRTLNTYPLNGLVLKTYQNDIFNNWLNQEWIEGENSISEMTKVAVVNGAFSMDSLNFTTKLYVMLNRVALAGNTKDDWEDVVYEEVERKHIETPIFIGGMSKEIVFDEVVQTAPAEIDGEEKELGTLGGRGRTEKDSQKGGTIHVKCDEACYIIGIASLTPRIYYTQGNDFDLTDITSLDDLHKPAMDGIGFQDLIGERLAWWDTTITKNTSTVAARSKVGKLPAWIEYMTSYNKAYGDFAEENAGFMVLSRRYEVSDTGGIKDATTYIDPQKYNYVFAYTNIEAQNFWLQIAFKVEARRLMSARIIPNV